MAPSRTGPRSSRGTPWFRWRADSPGWPGAEVAYVLTALGLAMITQPERFEYSEAFGGIIRFLDIRIWGAVYVLVGALFVGYLVGFPGRGAAMVIVAHTAGSVLTISWLMAFAFQWLTDQTTTAVTTIMWSMLLFLIIRSAILVAGADERTDAPS